MTGISDQALQFGAYNKYRYNGIEQVGDFGLQDYNAFFRNLDPQIGRWWQVDPKPNENTSQYETMLNNSIRNADPLGDTTFGFDTDGKYLGMFYTDDKGVNGALGKMIKYKDKDGKDQSYFEGDDYFTFNDPGFDVNQLLDMKVGDQGLMILSDENLNALLDNSQVNSDKAQGPINKWFYAKNQSNAGALDFSVEYFLDAKSLTAADDGKGGFVLMGSDNHKAYNLMDAGNYMWGMAMHALKISYSAAKIGSEGNESFHDSPADQRAISAGYFHVSKTNQSVMNAVFSNLPSVKDKNYFSKDHKR